MRFSLLTRDVRLIGTYYLRVPDEHPGYALLKPLHLTTGQLGQIMSHINRDLFYYPATSNFFRKNTRIRNRCRMLPAAIPLENDSPCIFILNSIFAHSYVSSMPIESAQFLHSSGIV